MKIKTSAVIPKYLVLVTEYGFVCRDLLFLPPCQVASHKHDIRQIRFTKRLPKHTAVRISNLVCAENEASLRCKIAGVTVLDFDYSLHFVEIITWEF